MKKTGESYTRTLRRYRRGSYGDVVETGNEPETSWNAAVMMAVPAEYAVSSPVLETAAIGDAVDFQVATFVTSLLLPSVYTTLAVSWLLWPTASVAGPAIATMSVETGADPSAASCTVKLVTGIESVAADVTYPGAAA